jgi:hypothetical protein
LVKVVNWVVNWRGTHWKALARALNPPLSESDLDRLLPALEALDRILRPAFETLPHDAMPWTAPE